MSFTTNPLADLITEENDLVTIRLDEQTGHQSMYSKKYFKPGDVITNFKAGEVLMNPTYLTVQLDADTHITLSPTYLQYCNHSCNPNVFFDVDRMEFVCLKPIAPEDEMRFFYPSTEWHMSQPFVCNCGEPNCLQLISGADSIALDIVSKYKLSGFIESKIIEKKGA